MKTTIKTVALGLFLVTTLAGCSALKVTRVNLAPPADKLDDARNAMNAPDGLVVNMNVPHEVVAVLAEKPGSDSVVTAEGTVLLPSQTEVYVVNDRGAMFTTRELKVELYDNMALKRVMLTANLDLAQDISSIADAAGGVADNLKGYEEAKAAAKTAKEERRKKALEEALAAQPKPKTVEQENDDIKKEIMNIMLKANLDALKAHQPLPYPDL